MSPDLCCLPPINNHTTRPFSPTEPARPLTTLNNGIFALAALPQDHPHALPISSINEEDGSLHSSGHSNSTSNLHQLFLRRRHRWKRENRHGQQDQRADDRATTATALARPLLQSQRQPLLHKSVSLPLFAASAKRIQVHPSAYSDDSDVCRPPRSAQQLQALPSPPSRSIARKFRAQLMSRRATVRSLKAEVVGGSVGTDSYDEDAKRLSSGEVRDAVDEGIDGSMDGALHEGGSRETSAGSAPMLKLRLKESSPLYSSSELVASERSAHALSARRTRSTLALGCAAERESDRLSGSSSGDVELRDLAYLNLDLAGRQFDGQANSLDFRLELTGEKTKDDGTWERSADPIKEECHPELLVDRDTLEDQAHHEANLDSAAGQIHAVDADDQADVAGTDERSVSHASFHLNRMHISLQLRSMSQLSGPSEGSDRLTPETWTFHRRERSDCLALPTKAESSRSRHLQNTLESGIDSAHVPTSWGRVTKEADDSSSIYSRSISPEITEPHEIPADLAAVTDWPLKREMSVPAISPSQHNALVSICQPNNAEDTHITIVEPDQQSITGNESTQGVTKLNSSHSSIRLNRAESYKSSSSSMTKHSRFLERFTPPKKLVTKRRSIFKFLHAGSRRNQNRSASTPVLCSPHLRPLVDGPAEDNELLTVQYELTSLERDPTRSVSLNNLPREALGGSQGVASSPDLRHKPSLLDYERQLSVVGDGRRRPSTRDLNRLSQIEEDGKHEHVPSKKSFSYFSERQDTDSLMQAALERQMREKAMFRSPSKQSVPFSESSSMSFAATSWNEPSSLRCQGDRDPDFEVEDKQLGVAHLSPPRTPVDGRSQASSSMHNQKQTSSKKPVLLHTPSSISRNSVKSRIASSLDSWSRYPSHTRDKRCASAGPSDNVRTFDFALDIKHDRLQGTDESDPFNPGKRVPTGTSPTRAQKKSLPQSRSATFGSFVRYYSNLFSSPDFHGKGRRTSVAAGGRLAYPELEMLSPGLPKAGNSKLAVDAHELEELLPTHLAHVEEHSEENGKRLEADVMADNPYQRVSGSPVTGPIQFRGDSVFSPRSPNQDIDHSIENVAGDDIQPSSTNEHSAAQNSPGPNLPNKPIERAPNLDGTSDTALKQSTSRSKAQVWSESYKDCLVAPALPVAAAVAAAASAPQKSTKAHLDPKSMPPPLLKPVKRRSLSHESPPHHHDQPHQRPLRLDPNASIRRFPSVTVVDDRKGHWRSVSFISVKSSKSAASGRGSSAGGFVRDSSNDLLVLMEMREREEREKLLRAL